MNQSVRKSISLGALVAALSEEASKVTSNKFERNVLVYMALRDLLREDRSHIMVPKA